MLVVDGQDRRAVAEIVVERDLRGRRRLDQQAVPVDHLPLAAPRRQMHQMLRLQDRLAVGVAGAVADIEDHPSTRDRARTQRASFSIRLK
jgi:hypothetical protein